jgi:hypothetical protein
MGGMAEQYDEQPVKNAPMQDGTQAPGKAMATARTL